MKSLFNNINKRFIGTYMHMDNSETKIKDLNLEVRVLKKNNEMYKEHIKELEGKIIRLMAVDEAHKNINGLLRARLKKMEVENKYLRESNENKEELLEDLYDV
tara:strand:+ start:129 stop:437 length:309 start_codon:yes stop_codon:yes gene_type:complete